MEYEIKAVERTQGPAECDYSRVVVRARARENDDVGVAHGRCNREDGDNLQIAVVR